MSDLLGAAAALEGALQVEGWQLRSSPTLKLGQQTLMPAMAGWRTSRVPRTGEALPPLAPFWIAEILAYKHTRLDRLDPLPVYAATGVQFVWLIDPGFHTLTVLRRVGRAWRVLQAHAESELVRIDPFALTLDLGQLWRADPLKLHA